MSDTHNKLQYGNNNNHWKVLDLVVDFKSSVFQPFCCSRIFRKCLRYSWNPMQLWNIDIATTE